MNNLDRKILDIEINPFALPALFVRSLSPPVDGRFWIRNVTSDSSAPKIANDAETHAQ